MVIWTLIALAVVTGCVYSVGFRKVIAALAGLLVVAAIGLNAWFGYQSRENRKREEAERQLVSADQLEFREMRMGISEGTNNLTGWLKNNSTYTIAEVTLRLVVQDCATPERCEIVGDTVESLSVEIPPNQSRAIRDYVYFRGLGEKHDRRGWYFEVKSIRAKPSGSR